MSSSLPEVSQKSDSLDVVLAPEDHHRMANLCGQFDEHLRQIERGLGIRIKNRGNHFRLDGTLKSIEVGQGVLEELFSLTEAEEIDPERVHLCMQEFSRVDREARQESMVFRTRRRDVRARGSNQNAYAMAMRSTDLTFGIGPAGTGKTYLAVAASVEALDTGTVRRIVLVRPAVEAGERLGFLPGDMSQKVDPYLRPMYDALYEMMGYERVGRLIERNIIEIAPLAFMRGRSLNESFIILDEAQNTTVQQMKMFLTRIGFGSRAVVTGDVTQTDLPKGLESGLKHANRILQDVLGVKFVHFDPQDVVRHRLVQKIVEAYSRDQG
ncbi:MAG: phosphate starvation-inducible protein PhoH [Gammaproteobacteria bacterium]|nr:phosphate starvation-inducible protein PhoH [Gammaproteobacteria bacterium]